ncbi:MAG: integron integrase, partial [Planctomycetales bacterium]|nr:integron integrase [Planctomycetales bacterium]
MSVKQMQAVVKRARLGEADRQWFPKLVREYASSTRQPVHQPIAIERDRVVKYLQQIKARGRLAWQRLQAVRAIEFYRDRVLKTDEPDLQDIRQTLAQAAEREQVQRTKASVATEPGRVGPLDVNEPEWLRQMRRELRLLHYSKRTEQAYVGWAQRFLDKLGAKRLEDLDGAGENEVKEFLSDLAVEGQVAASTQNQAFSALLFLFQKVLKRELQFVDAIRAKRPERLPVVLSREEIARLLGELAGRDLLMGQLLYGSGLRMLECLRLRVKDLLFEQQQIIVRDGKGEKDRATMMPAAAVEGLRRQIELVRDLHVRDLADGFGSVWLPYALERKYPDAGREFCWQYVFPAHKLSRDPRSGKTHRHHLHDGVFGAALKRAARRAKIEKKLTPHSLR